MQCFFDVCPPGAMRLGRHGLACCAVMLAVGTVGCQQRVASKLLGRWEGRPDTAAARAEREAEKFGRVSADLIQKDLADKVSGGADPAGRDSAGKESTANDSTGKDAVDKDAVGDDAIGDASIGDASVGKLSVTAAITDWESYEVTILIDFLSSEQVELSLGGEQTRAGTWKIISTSPTGCTIEVQTASGATKNGNPTVERRRFELLLDDRDGTCVGFLLTEAGVDRQQGAIYFQRPLSTGAAREN